MGAGGDSSRPTELPRGSGNGALLFLQKVKYFVIPQLYILFQWSSIVTAPFVIICTPSFLYIYTDIVELGPVLYKDIRQISLPLDVNQQTNQSINKD